MKTNFYQIKCVDMREGKETLFYGEGTSFAEVAGKAEKETLAKDENKCLTLVAIHLVGAKEF